MVKILGTSKIDVDMAAFGQTLESCIPEGTGDLEVKLDARGNVRSTFMQTDGKIPGKATIYTGAVEALWDTSFKSSDGPKDALQAMLFIGGLAALKFQNRKKFSMKVDTMNNTRVEDDFESVKGVLEGLCANYQSAASANPAGTTVKTKASSAGKKTKKEKHVPQPVENVPEADIPVDLDLVGTEEVKAAVEPIKVQSSAELEAEVSTKVGEALATEHLATPDLEAPAVEEALQEQGGASEEVQSEEASQPAASEEAPVDTPEETESEEATGEATGEAAPAEEELDLDAPLV